MIKSKSFLAYNFQTYASTMENGSNQNAMAWGYYFGLMEAGMKANGKMIKATAMEL